jgi:hypothetical protein
VILLSTGFGPLAVIQVALWRLVVEFTRFYLILYGECRFPEEKNNDDSGMLDFGAFCMPIKKREN